jgi:hypothetical protein
VGLGAYHTHILTLPSQLKRILEMSLTKGSLIKYFIALIKKELTGKH